MKPVIFHVDLDAFFVAVERVVDPSLIGKPVVVGGSPDGRGVVTSASYEARVFGVRSAMSAAVAKRLCPEAVFVRGSRHLYGKFSRQFMDVLRDFSPLVQPASIDEAYMDMTGTDRLFGPPVEAATKIRSRVTNEVQLTASIGIGESKLVAKVASNVAKPNGVHEVPAGASAAFFAPMPLRALPGIGPKAEKGLRMLGIKTLGQLARFEIGPLRRSLGVNHAESIQRRARGIGSAELSIGQGAKSISAETTFGEDSDDMDFLSGTLQKLSERVGVRLRKSGKFARSVSLKLRYHDWETISRQVTLPAPADGDATITTAGRELLRKAMTKRKAKVRLVGVGVGNLTEQVGQMSLLEDVASSGPGGLDSRLSGTMDKIRTRFGHDAIQRGQSQAKKRE
jgi:DNA polymerase-4